MLTYGSDRSRVAGGKVILHAPFSKGWTARTAKTSTRGTHPGTAVLWNEQYFEVLSADVLPAGGVRYVLGPWPDNETIRVFESYDESSEAQRITEYETALRQQKHSLAAHFSGIILGHLPAVVQNHLQNTLGVTPTRMTLLSIIPFLIYIAVCLGLTVGAVVKQQPAPLPLAALFLAGYLVLESLIRFQIVMSQSRGVGSAIGVAIYLVVWLFASNRLVSPFAVERGRGTFTLPPPDDVALRDSVETRGVMLSLLPASEQQQLAVRTGYDYRKFAPAVAWIFLTGSAIGLVNSLTKHTYVAAAVAAAIAVEQVIRLVAFRKGPAGSMFGIFVRPFVRDLLRR